MLIGRLPVAGLRAFRSIHAQNLAQSAMSAATFGAANSLLLPIGVPFLLGREDLVLPMLGGVACAMFLDAYLLYRLFGSRIFPADGAWPPGLAAAEAIRAGDAGGGHARVLVGSVAAGAVGAWLHLPMAAFGTAFIGNAWALSMFGLGLLASGYSPTPARPVALGALRAARHDDWRRTGGARGRWRQQLRPHAGASARTDAADQAADRRLGPTLRAGAVGYLAIATGIALAGGLPGVARARCAAALRRLCRPGRLRARAAGGARGDALGLVPGLRRGPHHPAARHDAGLSARRAGPAGRLLGGDRPGLRGHGLRPQDRLRPAREGRRPGVRTRGPAPAVPRRRGGVCHRPGRGGAVVARLLRRRARAAGGPGLCRDHWRRSRSRCGHFAATLGSAGRAPPTGRWFTATAGRAARHRAAHLPIRLRDGA